MKKLITTIVLSIIMVSLTNAQIKKPTVKVNTTSIKTNTNLQGIKVNDLSRLKSIEDLDHENFVKFGITSNCKRRFDWYDKNLVGD